MNRRALMLALLVWSVATASEARLQTGSLVVEVVGMDGGPLPAAAVTLEGPRLPGLVLRETDEHGRARFPWLSPGPYTITLELAGHAVIRIAHEVALGLARVERVVLTPGELVETMIVTPLRLDAAESGLDITVGRDVLQATQLGSGQRSETAVAGQAAGVAPGRNPSIHGSSIGENRYLVDGMDTTSPAWGTRRKSLPFDAIEAVELKTGAFRAEYGLATGGILNAVTKSGGDEFEGTLDLRYSDERFAESSPFAEDVPSEDRDASVTLGGPLVPKRLWFFLAGGDRRESRRPLGAPVTRRSEASSALAKLTWHASPAHRLAVSWSADKQDIENADASPQRTAEATVDSRHRGEVLSATWWGRLGKRWSVSALAGRQSIEGAVVAKGEPDVSPRWNSFNSHLSGNASLETSQEERRRQFALKAERFAGGERWHRLRLGVELQDTSLSWRARRPGLDLGGVTEGTPGPYLERVDWDPDPDGDGVDEDPFGRGLEVPVLRWDVRIFPEGTRTKLLVASVYVQDTWRASRRLTLDLGLRHDQIRVDGLETIHLASPSVLQPRLGATVDLTGSGKHLLDVHLGRFMDPGFLNPFSQVGAGGDMQSYAIYGNELRAGVDCNLDGELTRGRTLCASYGGPGKGAVDPQLRAMVVDEATLGSRHALSRDLTLSARYLFRQTSDIVDWQHDTETGTWTVRNQPWLVRRYQGLEVDVAWESGRWHVFGNWTLSWNEGNAEYTAGTGFAFFDLATSRNRYGWLARDRRHRVKTHGWVELPRRWRVAWDATWVTGAPYDRLAAAPQLGVEYLEPRGSHRLGTYHLVDLEARKNWQIGQLGLTFIATLLNATGSNEVTRVGEFPGDFGEPIDHLPPRRWEAGLRLSW